jgi:cytochrome o ubiquinol oxidase subunit 3
MSSTTLTDHPESDHHLHDATENATFGFWLYLMTDCILFASLFATYAVLYQNTASGPGGPEIFDLPYVFGETMFLLVSAFTNGVAMSFVYKKDRQKAVFWLIVTALLGLGFIVMEVNEFIHLIGEGNGPDRSGFLSAFFGLVGTHGAHVSIGLIWMAVMIGQLLIKGVTPKVSSRLIRLSLFWHFLDIVWVCLFTVVYLFGVA